MRRATRRGVPDLRRARPPLRAGLPRRPRAGHAARPTGSRSTAPRSGRTRPTRPARPDDRDPGAGRSRCGWRSGRAGPRSATTREGNRSHGVDALRAYALRMAGLTDASREDDPDPGDGVSWPDLVLFLGDQVYADETTEEMQAFIESRRDIDEPPGAELQDYQEYAELYRLAWTDPVNRWLLSTVPTRDDLRRPRHPRRLEHLAGVEGRDGGHRLVARADRQRARVVLGLPAPRQPLPRRPGRGRDLAAHPRAAESRRLRGPRRVRRPGRPAPRDLPLVLHPRLRHPGPVGRRRLPQRAGARPRPPLAARRGGAGLARRAGASAGSTTC